MNGIIITLQQTLSALKYDIDVNGKFDDKTEDAIKSFQRVMGLPPTGILDRATINKFTLMQY